MTVYFGDSEAVVSSCRYPLNGNMIFNRERNRNLYLRAFGLSNKTNVLFVPLVLCVLLDSKCFHNTGVTNTYFGLSRIFGFQ